MADPTWTKARKETLKAYIADLQVALGLRYWRFIIHWDTPPEDPKAGASVEAIWGRKLAHLKWGSTFLTEDPEEQRHYVVHELIHCHFEPAANVVECDLVGQLSQATYQATRNAFLQNLEHAVDGLAAAIAERLPLPKLD